MNPANNSAARRSYVRYAVIGWFSSAAAIAYLCRTCLSVAEIEVRTDLGISKADMGWILGPAFFWVYALGQIPMGWLGTRLGARLLIPVLACAWSAATMAMACSRTMGAVVCFFAVSGLAQAGLFPAATTAFSRWLPGTERAIASGILGASMSLGGAFVGILTGYLLGIESLTWRPIFFSYGFIGVIWAAGFWWRYRDTPSEHPRVTRKERETIESGRTSPATGPAIGSHRTNPDAGPSDVFVKLLCSPGVWLICAQQFFRAAAYQFFFSWFVTWLREARGVSVEQSGWLVSVPMLATVASAVSGGWLSDVVYRRTGSLKLARQGLSAGFLILSTGFIVASILVVEPLTAVVVLSMGVFFAGVAAPCSYAVTIDLGGRHVALLFSMMNMIGNFGAGWLPWFVPRLRDWVDQSPAWVEAFGGSSWNAVLLMIGLLNLLGAVAWILLRSDTDVLQQSLFRHRSRTKP